MTPSSLSCEFLPRLISGQLSVTQATVDEVLEHEAPGSSIWRRGGMWCDRLWSRCAPLLHLWSLFYEIRSTSGAAAFVRSTSPCQRFVGAGTGACPYGQRGGYLT
jgi:hypothetical protein